MKQVLSFNVSCLNRPGAVEVMRDVVRLMHDANMEPGMHTGHKVAEGIYSVRVPFDSSAAHGPRVIRTMQGIRAIPQVDAVKTL